MTEDELEDHFDWFEINILEGEFDLYFLEDNKRIGGPGHNFQIQDCDLQLQVEKFGFIGWCILIKVR